MAHFAELNENNVVTRIVVIGNDIPTSKGPLGENDKAVEGEQYCKNLFGGNWKQSSYNHNFRKQHAGIGYTYDLINDVFITPKPYPSWALDNNFDWKPPVEQPLAPYSLNYEMIWSESDQRWESNDLMNLGPKKIWNPNISAWE